ncbi:hypothetical protein V5E97_06275 [Singulisphaera sp. Ch08]|uniref:Uncharacterized protein n=1 Tax=Singulisphaera sp. Ch08 TaxID=3120278 RepID=A0AAU7CK21_9BACT
MTLSDAMIGVAVTAAGLAIARACLLHVTPGATGWFAVRISTTFVALALTITLLLLRFRQPRPRRPCRHPGSVACCAVAFASALIFVIWVSYWLMPGPSPPSFVRSDRTVVLVANVLRLELYSFTVAGAWLALAVSGRWRPGPDWIDRAGRILGVLWIASPFLERFIK